MEKILNCLRCGENLKLIGSEKLQLGETGRPFSNLLAGALEVDLYYCKNCGKLEFYHRKDELLPNVQCPNCGKNHHKDYPKCPFCKYDYKNK